MPFVVAFGDPCGWFGERHFLTDLLSVAALEFVAVLIVPVVVFAGIWWVGWAWRLSAYSSLLVLDTDTAPGLSPPVPSGSPAAAMRVWPPSRPRAVGRDPQRAKVPPIEGRGYPSALRIRRRTTVASTDHRVTSGSRGAATKATQSRKTELSSA
ncbi:MAG: hypothetical protein M2R45_03340 [Verrucomicrobia subdivision 3 bacterium]|nr:hypothetical protein [Limisphaerales bacterium]MCS1415378.1 hypothetical protein [Limisphaerales bacterium]